MEKLSGLEPKKVFEYFEEICSIPRGSGNIWHISDYLAAFAGDHELKYRQDALGNIIIWKDGTSGYEDCKPVILQGHMDMVAVKNDDCGKDMKKEGVDLILEGDRITADGTSLGADDGVAVAMCLALLDSTDIPHPPLECVITVDEEVGMLGASALDTSDLSGRTLINIDSEEEGVFIVSCAGGAIAKASFPYRQEVISSPVINIKIGGLTGGHSGVEIDKDRLNANIVVGRILLNLMQNMEIRLVSINGGAADNAIPDSCEASFALSQEDGAREKAEKIIQDTYSAIKEENRINEKNIKLETGYTDIDTITAMSGMATLSVIIAMNILPDGVQRMDPVIKGAVRTSLNLGLVRTSKDNVVLTYLVRSSSDSEKEYLTEKIRSVADIFAGDFSLEGVYTGWDRNDNSEIVPLCVESYQRITGKKADVVGMHAGVECGIFASKIPGLDVVSTGPDIYGIHTVNESLSVSSTETVWKVIIDVLGKCRHDKI